MTDLSIGHRHTGKGIRPADQYKMGLKIWRAEFASLPVFEFKTHFDFIAQQDRVAAYLDAEFSILLGHHCSAEKQCERVKDQIAHVKVFAIQFLH